MKDPKRETLRRLSWWESARKVAVADKELVDAGAMGKVVWSLQQDARRLGATDVEIDRAMGRRSSRGSRAGGAAEGASTDPGKSKSAASDSALGGQALTLVARQRP